MIDRAGLDGPARRAALSDWYDRWLTGLLPERRGVALVAIGGLGRREPAPYGDLDLVLVHTGQSDVDEVAKAIWYPIWDAGLQLDHSVRTVAESVEVARGDLKAALGLLDVRHVAGDAELSATLLTAARSAWRTGLARRVEEIEQATQQRWAARGELAFLLEPDLKESRGGLRDVQLLRALAAAQVSDPPWLALRPAHRRLLDVRDALQLAAGRGLDRLVAQEQPAVAAALGLAGPDGLLRALADAGRTVAFSVDGAWRSVRGAVEARRRPLRRRTELSRRRPLADGVVAQDGEVVLARSADPAGDPGLALRVAAAAGSAGLPIGRHTLARLGHHPPPVPEPWPDEVRDAFLRLLGCGPGLVAAWEALDQAGLLDPLLPEWRRVRSLPQRNPVHRFTVDRHLVETAVQAAAMARRVRRPDLLLLAAVVHDLGKGWPGDHTAAGVAVVPGVLRRIGLPAGDAAVVTDLVRYHLLLAVTATRRDLDDPATAATVAEAVHGDEGVLELLAALTEADGLATGPAAWTDWKAGLVVGLVSRTRRLLGGRPPLGPADPPADLVAAGRAGPVVRLAGGELIVAATAGPGLLSRLAGALAVHRLEVLSASATTVDGVAVVAFTARPRYGSPPDPVLLRADLARAAVGGLASLAKLDRRPADSAARPDPVVAWIDDAATAATILEVRAADAPGLLYRVTRALEECGATIRQARVSTLGGDVVDAFYLDGQVPSAARGRLAAAVLAAAG